MINRKKTHSSSSGWMSILSLLKPRNLIVFLLLATSATTALAQAATEPKASTPDLPPSNTGMIGLPKVTTYMRGSENGRFLASKSDTVFPASGCKLEIMPQDTDNFYVEQNCNTVHLNVATQAVSNTYTGDKLESGIVTREKEWEDGAKITSILDFPKKYVVRENHSVRGGDSTTTETAVYLASTGIEYKAAADEIVRPQSGCLLTISPNDVEMTPQSTFTVSQNCATKGLPAVSSTRYNEFNVDELNKSKGIRHRLFYNGEKEKTTLDFSVGKSVVQETVVRMKA